VNINRIKDYILMVLLELMSNTQNSAKDTTKTPGILNSIIIIFISCLFAFGSLLILIFIFGMAKLKLSSTLLFVLAICFCIYLLFRLTSKRGYSFREVFRINFIGFKYIITLIVIGIGLALIMGETVHLLRLGIELLSANSMIPVRESELLKEPLIIIFIYRAISMPILEELIFKGLLLSSLENSLGPIKAVFYISLIFTLSHIVHPISLIAIFITSIPSVIIVLKTNSIISGIIIHIINNGMSFVFIRVMHFKDYSDMFGQNSNHVYIQSLLMLIIGIFLFAIGFRWLSRIAKSDKSNLIIKVEPQAPLARS
jgi:membrane protease YdiL (CAAX protease family)